MRIDLVRAALAQRLQQVQTLYSNTSAEAPIVQECADPEEVLRVVMVRLFPRMQAQKAKPEEITQYFDSLAHLMRAALGEDWRYLDAWNNAFEVILPQRENLPEDRVLLFCQQYAFLLKAHLQDD